MRTLENALRRVGFVHVAGVDEVGRGCLAGPVVAAAVVLHPERHIAGVCDSKTVPAPERERLYDRILRSAVAWAVGEADPSEIDRINIHQASLRAMQRAILALAPLPDIVLVDAFRVPELPMAQRGVPHGDRRCSAIAAASIVAKVTRDRQMLELHSRDPRYGFDRHKGYATADHLSAVARFGYSDAHRRSFRPSSAFDTIEDPCHHRPCRAVLRNAEAAPSEEAGSRDCRLSEGRRGSAARLEHGERARRLYVRAGRVDKAVEQYTRIADSLNEEGFLPKAGALYKKVLKIKPDHEHALIQGAEIAVSQGLLLDARTYLNAVAERRRARGDQRGAAQMRIRLGNLDPADFEARTSAARARVEIGDTPGALRDLKEIAAELSAKSRDADAVEVLREAAGLDPNDEDLRERLLAVYIGAGDFARARECAGTPAQFKSLAAALEEKGDPGHALEALREGARLDPEDTELRTALARLRARGDLTTAADYLTVESAGNDPHLLMTVAEMRLRSGLIDEGAEIVKRLLDGDPARREEIALVGWRVAEHNPDAGFRVVELAADTAVAQGDWAGAAAALQEFVTRVHGHVPALMRLVEICVDGGLEATMYSAQGQLADAYIEAGAAAEARFIAEDLVAREPWERANVERFRRALVLLGEPDPDALIAERLSGQSPFTSTDLSFGDLPPFDEPPATPMAPEAEPQPEPEPDVEAAPVKASKAKHKKGDSSHFALSSNAIDLDSILGEFDSPPLAAKKPAEHTGKADKTETAEIDLSVELDVFQQTPPAPPNKNDRRRRMRFEQRGVRAPARSGLQGVDGGRPI